MGGPTANNRKRESGAAGRRWELAYERPRVVVQIARDPSFRHNPHFFAVGLKADAALLADILTHESPPCPPAGPTGSVSRPSAPASPSKDWKTVPTRPASYPATSAGQWRLGTAVLARALETGRAARLPQHAPRRGKSSPDQPGESGGQVRPPQEHGVSQVTALLKQSMDGAEIEQSKAGGLGHTALRGERPFTH